jgi:APA family basic amino acid/polyamine antiporter
MMGLGSIVGTGVFVSLGIGAGVAGPALLLAIAIGGLLAACNGLSSAQLAAAHPVSGGTYAYGQRFLSGPFGFAAGWLFLLAKSASAATAALGFSGYLLRLLGVGGAGWIAPLALLAALGVAGVVLLGIRRSTAVNIAIVTVTLAGLLLFVVAGLPSALEGAAANLTPLLQPEAGRSWPQALLFASALMFVAFTGYGRIATLGEEVRDPQRTIPRAVVAALVTVALLYLAVAFVGVASVGASALADPAVRAAPLEAAAERFGSAWLPVALTVAAVTAMLGVLLNLVLGLSRVLLAMGRGGDVPERFARLDPSGATPTAAVIAVGLLVALLTLIGDVRLTWSFSAFTVLVYYAITNLAALWLPPDLRRFPRWVAWLGLLGCLSLALFVEWRVLLAGVAALALGFGLRTVYRRLRRSR